MKFTPHQYQLDAMQFLLQQPHAGLLLDMGLGKTSISLTALKLMLASGHVRKVLLIAPIRPLYAVWPNEIAKWEELSDLTYHNWHESRAQLGHLPKAQIHGINPESALPILKSSAFKREGFDMLIIDEAHTFKNSASQRFKVLKPLLHTFKYRWILTGTPAPNGLEDLWSQIFILDRGEALGQFITHFRNYYCMPDRSGYGYVVMDNYKSEIYRKISPLVYRLAARDHLDMPDFVVNPIPVVLPPAAMEAYKTMERELLLLLESGELITSPNSAVAGMRCRQIANGGIYLPDGTAEHIHSAKADALKEVVDGLQGQPLLVFYEFIHDIARIVKAVGNVPNLTQSRTPDKLINEFNAGKHPVMIGHPATIGSGLNLQGACSNVLWMGVPWDLGLLDQANARVCRQGQEADRVVAHYLMAQNTLDAVVLKAVQAKGRVQLDLLNAIQSIRSETYA
jgi:SNF2 family DNA or RNA helicase